MRRIIAPRIALHVAMLAILTFTATGCIFVAKGSDHNQSPTLGKQLVDLKTAHDTGALSDQDYQAARSKLLSDSK